MKHIKYMKYENMRAKVTKQKFITSRISQRNFFKF